MEEEPTNVVSNNGTAPQQQEMCFSRNFIKMEKCKNNSTTNKNRNSFPLKYSFTKDTSTGKQVTTANGTAGAFGGYNRQFGGK